MRPWRDGSFTGFRTSAGKLIGDRYQVEGTLGRGGMGSVYRVRDTHTGEQLALKRSRSDDGARAARRRLFLEREFNMLAHLCHPRIIEVHEYGVDELGPYYTMELLDGADLDKAGPVPWQQACGLLRDIASSLAIVHSRSLIHRDVSARNVRRTADGRAKLIDFGSVVSMGVANDVVGTPPFLAPEVLQMQALAAAWLVALAEKAERVQLMVVMSAEPDDEARASGPLHLFRVLAERVPLPPLDAAQTDSLMRSVFGEVPNIGLFAGRVYDRAQGNPRVTMELAQHLVDAKIAQYEGGSWILPQLLDAAEVPATLSDSLARRLGTLSADARDLVEALAIVGGLKLPPTGYRELTAHGDRDRLFRALEELVAARILSATADRYRFAQRSIVPVVLSSLSPARKAALHARAASLIARSGGDALERAEHLMLAGLRDECVELLRGLDLQARPPALWLLEQAVAHAEQTAALPTRALHDLRMALLTKASVAIDMRRFRRELPPVIRQLERDSGLELYRELRDLPEATRLSEALTRQQQGFVATPEHLKVFGVAEAIRELARLISAACGIASATFDLALLEELPSLEPFLPLSPSLHVIEQVKTASQLWMSGRMHQASAIYEAALARIGHPDRAGLDEVQVERLQLALMNEAARVGMQARLTMAKYQALAGPRHSALDSELLTTTSRIMTARQGTTERATAALDIICAAHGARGGHLFLITPAGTSLCASKGGCAPPDGLADFVATYNSEQQRRATELDDMATSAGTGTDALPAPVSSGDRIHQLLTLRCMVEGATVLVGVAALECDGGNEIEPQVQLLNLLSMSLLESGETERSGS